MFYNAKNGNIKVDNSDIDFISFGIGSKNLVMITGLGDGLKTVKGTALPFAIMYRKYAQEYRVHVFSRKNQFDTGYSTRDMAKDCITAMQQLGITKADIMGISQGGMIAQYIAIDYPEVVNKLVLVVTLSKPNESVLKVIGTWIKMAEAGDYKNLVIDTAEKMYSEKYLKRNGWMYPIIGSIGKPKDFNRFIIMANACLSHDSYNELEKIMCPTLVIGADGDNVVGVKASEEIAEKINGCKLFIYEGLGHGVYEEAKDFNSRVLNFIERLT